MRSGYLVFMIIFHNLVAYKLKIIAYEGIDRLDAEGELTETSLGTLGFQYLSHALPTSGEGVCFVW